MGTGAVLVVVQPGSGQIDIALDPEKIVLPPPGASDDETLGVDSAAQQVG